MRVVPFCAVRPEKNKVHLVATRSYLSYTPSQLRYKLSGNPYSFLNIIHPDMSETKMHQVENPEERFKLVRERYEEFVADGILKKDDKPSYYLYQQIKAERIFTGIIAGVSIEDYNQGKIKIHEQTLSKREDMFASYLGTTNINAEPVLLMSPESDALNILYKKYAALTPEYDYFTSDGVHHRLWLISDSGDIQAISKIYADMDSLYIADGHHRSSSSARLCEMRKSANITGNEPWNYCLAYIISEKSVKIYEFNRVVKDLNGLSRDEFLNRIGEFFEVNETTENYSPKAKGEIAMLIGKKWYVLKLKKADEKLDTQLLSELILSPILGVHDLRKDKRILFVEGPKGATGLEEILSKHKNGVAFRLFPIPVSEIKKIADHNECMPPKSTWIEPKLRSGLIVYELGR